MRHVDIVKNEWLAGYQFVVARAFVDAGAVVVDSSDLPAWEHVVLRPILDRDNGELLFPEKDPELFVESLPKAMHGTYLFATDPHEEAECSYAVQHFVVPMQSSPISKNVTDDNGELLGSGKATPRAKRQGGQVRARKTAKTAKAATKSTARKRIAAKSAAKRRGHR
jgi:hypothetical protein